MGRKVLLLDFTCFLHVASRIEQQSDLIGLHIWRSPAMCKQSSDEKVAIPVMFKH